MGSRGTGGKMEMWTLGMGWQTGDGAPDRGGVPVMG